MDENRANIIVAVVAVAAIVGLVASFSGVNLSGLSHAFNPGSPPADRDIDPALAQYHDIGIDLGVACLQNWDVATQGPYDDCCSASCGAVCTDGNCYTRCVRGCYNSMNAAFGYS